MRTINNESRLVRAIENLNIEGLEAWSDDGSVGVNFNGDQGQTVEVLRTLVETFGESPRVGDGVQEGHFWFANSNLGMNGELSDFTHLLA